MEEVGHPSLLCSKEGFSESTWCILGPYGRSDKSEVILNWCHVGSKWPLRKLMSAFQNIPFVKLCKRSFRLLSKSFNSIQFTAHSHALITLNFPSGSNREMVGDYVHKQALVHHFSHYDSWRCRWMVYFFYRKSIFFLSRVDFYIFLYSVIFLVFKLYFGMFPKLFRVIQGGFFCFLFILIP